MDTNATPEKRPAVEAERAGYERSIVRLRDATRAFHAAALATIEAVKRYDPDDVAPMSPAVESIVGEINALLLHAGNSAPNVAQLFGVVGANCAPEATRAALVSRDAAAAKSAAPAAGDAALRERLGLRRIVEEDSSGPRPGDTPAVCGEAALGKTVLGVG